MQTASLIPKIDLSLLSSEREILRVVQVHGPISRANITQHTHLTQQSVHRLVEGLIEKRLFQLADPVIKGRGKPSPQIIVDKDAYISLGVGLTSGSVELSGVNLQGDAIFSELIDVDPNDCDIVLEAVRERAREILSEPALGNRHAIGLGVAVQGYRRGDPNRYKTPPFNSNWIGKPIDEVFSQATGLPAFSENNANCCAIAEYYCGAAKDLDCFAVISFNQGLGGGLVYMGQPVFGGHGNAGELTRLWVEKERAYRPALGELLSRLKGNGVALANVHEMISEFDADWPGVEDWIREVTPALKLLVRALIAIADPSAIFFGGEAPQALRHKLADASLYDDEDGPPCPRLMVSGIEGDASSIGAAILPLQRMIF